MREKSLYREESSSIYISRYGEKGKRDMCATMHLALGNGVNTRRARGNVFASRDVYRVSAVSQKRSRGVCAPRPRYSKNAGWIFGFVRNRACDGRAGGKPSRSAMNSKKSSLKERAADPSEHPLQGAGDRTMTHFVPEERRREAREGLL